MIDYINNSAPPKIPVGGSPGGTSASQAKPTQAAPAPTMPDAEVSVIGAKATVAELAKTPPIDLEAVGKIKEAISRGAYPVDLDKIAEKLMESFIESHG
ncbi:flagellar biosynthesis anti-sigma factor FlgM [Roseicyclus sp.]|uniref:flagellar biosynthesis anti-sigma factor FlgM n=1 Tax=Roseicyclus sp. TaxID=1914329 RepID=UPI003F6C753B